METEVIIEIDTVETVEANLSANASSTLIIENVLCGLAPHSEQPNDLLIQQAEPPGEDDNEISRGDDSEKVDCTMKSSETNVEKHEILHMTFPSDSNLLTQNISTLGRTKHELSLGERREMALKVAESEKQARLAQFLGVGSSEEKGHTSERRSSVKDRYEAAKKEQQKQEEDRVQKLKNQPSKGKVRGSVAGLWAGALNNSKVNEDNRVAQTKEATISQFRVTDGTGVVRRRIGEWEELFMQIAVSVEQLEATIQAAIARGQQYASMRADANTARRARTHSQAEAFPDERDSLTSPSNCDGADTPRLHQPNNNNTPERFVSGSTSIYNVAQLSRHQSNIVSKAITDNNGMPKPLPCGVYGDQAAKPPIHVVAVAMTLKDDNIYIALTISPGIGHEFDSIAFGVKKVAIFSPDGSEAVFERIFDIVPAQGWDEWLVMANKTGDVMNSICSPEPLTPAPEVLPCSNIDDHTPLSESQQSTAVVSLAAEMNSCLQNLDNATAQVASSQNVDCTTDTSMEAALNQDLDSPTVSVEQIQSSNDYNTEAASRDTALDVFNDETPAAGVMVVEAFSNKELVTENVTASVEETEDIVPSVQINNVPSTPFQLEIQEIDLEDIIASPEGSDMYSPFLYAVVPNNSHRDIDTTLVAETVASDDDDNEDRDKFDNNESFGVASSPFLCEVVHHDHHTSKLVQPEEIRLECVTPTRLDAEMADASNDNQAPVVTEVASPMDEGDNTWRDRPSPCVEHNALTQSPMAHHQQAAPRIAPIDISEVPVRTNMPFSPSMTATFTDDESAGEESNFGSPMSHLALGSPMSNTEDRESITEEEDDEPGSIFNFGRVASIAGVKAPKLFDPNQPVNAAGNNSWGFGGKSGKAMKGPWTIDDERDDRLEMASQMKLDVDITCIKSMTCAPYCVILQSNTASTVITGTFKMTSTNSRMIVSNNQVFEWVKGAACSGWMQKWPMKSQRAGRISRRFFILRDNVLSYHSSKPKSEDEASSDYAKSSLILTHNTTVSTGRHYLMRCLTIETPIDTMWMKLKGDFEEELKWTEEMKYSIAQLSRQRLFQSKAHVECIWHHESINYSCVAVDAKISSQACYTHAALFKLKAVVARPGSSARDSIKSSFTADELNDVNAGRKGNTRRRSLSFMFTRSPPPAPRASIASTISTSSSSSTGAAKPTDSYAIDIGTNDSERVQLEVLNMFGSADLNSNLICIKVCGEHVILGGSCGFIGICTLGSIGYDSNSKCKRVMYCTTANTVSSSPMSSPTMPEPAFKQHSALATITCLDSSLNGRYFVAGDDLGGLSLWQMGSKTGVDSSEEGSPGAARDRRGNARLVHFISLSELDSGRARPIDHESIVSVQFMPNQLQVLVASHERLLLISLEPSSTATDPRRPSQPDLNWTAWTCLDRAPPDAKTIFTVSVTEHYQPLFAGATTASVLRRMVVWKLVNDTEGVGLRRASATVYRFEWSDEMLDAALKRLKLIYDTKQVDSATLDDEEY